MIRSSLHVDTGRYKSKLSFRSNVVIKIVSSTKALHLTNHVGVKRSYQ